MAGTSLPALRRWRSIDISGTSPEPPAISISGIVSLASHTNQPPNGPRTSNSSPSRATWTNQGETSPSKSSSTVIIGWPSSGAEAIE